MQMMRDRIRRGFDDVESIWAFLDQHEIDAPPAYIGDRFKRMVGELVARDLTAQAIVLMLKCSPEDARQPADAAWAGVIQAMNKRAGEASAA